MTFTATQFHTVEQKEKMFRKLKLFITKGCKPGDFTKEMYNQVNGMFGHIAHYDRAGFVNVWFSYPYDRYRWLTNILDFKHYGNPAYTWGDVERTLQDFVRFHPDIVQSHLTEHNMAVDRAERAELARLKAKYPEEV